MSNNSTTTTTTTATSPPTSTNETQTIYDYMNNIFMNPTVVIILFIVLIAYFAIFSSLGGNNQTSTVSSTSGSFMSGDAPSDSSLSSSSSSIAGSVIGVIAIALFVILILINGLQYFFGIDVMASIHNFFGNSTQVDIKVDESKLFGGSSSSIVPEIIKRPQVFNIPGNTYGYNDAKALCTAYGSRLATYKEVEDAYNSGAEWCNYGWSDNQNALFPVQQATYDKLQKIPGHENDCGRPGVNGGYIANPQVQFGVNCFGYKPNMTEEEEQLMSSTTPYPKTEKDLLMEKRVEYWKNRLSEILVSPFNYTTWSRI
uniref:Link domain-containing protein n=1 Tax=viral metagenome TaxID=1070528 RepID=A0A6C0F890_9ZZZZ